MLKRMKWLELLLCLAVLCCVPCIVSAENPGTGWPVLYLETDHDVDTLLGSEKGYTDTGAIQIVGTDGQLLLRDTLTQLKLHGNSTLNYEKKAFQFKLSRKASLFGMEADKTWILLANYIDHSLLRNQLALHLSEAVGLPYTPQCQPVEVCLNGEYIGNYLLCEKVQIGTGRVEIGQGWLLEAVQTVGNNHDVPDFTTPSGWAFVIKDAEPADRTDTNTVITLFAQIDRLLSDPDGWEELCGIMDTESLVRKYVLDELLANYDGGTGSQYFIVDTGGEQPRIACGPVWDYDNILGINITKGRPDAFYVNQPAQQRGRWGSAPLFARLWQMQGFRQAAMACYWQDFRPLMEETILWLTGQAQQMQASAERNFARWPIQYDYHPRVQNTGDTYEQNVDSLITFLRQRIAFLDREWAD